MKIRIKEYLSIDIILLFFIIFMSGGIHIIPVSVLTGIIYGIIFLIYFTRIEYRKLHKKLIMPIIILVILFFYVLGIAPYSNEFKFLFFRYTKFIIVVLYINYVIIKKVDVIRKIYLLLVFFLVHALAGFVMSYLAEPLYQDIATENSVYKSFFYLFFFGDKGALGNRLYGMFWEPGVLQYYMNILVFISLFYIRNTYILIAAIIAVILTQSSTGLLILALQGIFYLIYNIKKLNFAYSVFILGILIGSVSFIKTNIEEKVSGKRYGSFLARQYDTFTGLTVAQEYPQGIGFSHDRYKQLTNSGLRFKEGAKILGGKMVENRGNSNSILYLLYGLGIFWAILILYFLYRQTLFEDKKVLFFLINVITFNSEPILFLPFPFILIVYGMSTFLIRESKRKMVLNGQIPIGPGINKINSRFI